MSKVELKQWLAQASPKEIRLYSKAVTEMLNESQIQAILGYFETRTIFRPSFNEREPEEPKEDDKLI